MASLSRPLQHILLAEPDAGICEALEGWLTSEGYSTAVARRPVVLNALRDIVAFDLIIADAAFSGRGGLRWVERLLTEPHCPPVILTATQPSLPLAIAAANLPIVGLFSKPLDREALGLRVREVLAPARR